MAKVFAKGGYAVDRTRRALRAAVFALYCLMMLLLLFYRSPNEAGLPFPVYLRTHLNLVPLRTIRRFSRLLIPPVRPYLVRIALRNLLGNILLFVPFGYFLPKLFPGLRSFLLTAAAVTVTICCVEILQVLFTVGTCDIDDLILNLLGASMGYGIYKILER